MAKLDAINEMLEYIGEAEIPDTVSIDGLEDGHIGRVSLSILDRELRKAQQDPYWFNKANVTLVPDEQGFITMPYNIISYKNEDLILDGGKLYDKTAFSKKFSSPINLECLVFSEYEDLPEIFTSYVVLLASLKLNSSTTRSDSLRNELYQLRQEQLLRLKKENFKQKPYNWILGNKLLIRNSNPTPAR